MLSRKNEPAIINYYSNGNIKKQVWLKLNKKHREDGPAVILYDINGNVIEEEYFLDGDKMDELTFLVKLENEKCL